MVGELSVPRYSIHWLLNQKYLCWISTQQVVSWLRFWFPKALAPFLSFCFPCPLRLFVDIGYETSILLHVFIRVILQFTFVWWSRFHGFQCMWTVLFSSIHFLFFPPSKSYSRMAWKQFLNFSFLLYFDFHLIHVSLFNGRITLLLGHDGNTLKSRKSCSLLHHFERFRTNWQSWMWQLS